eukprot:GCRY01000567.1.p1 GENE.GCRY01000567.1~~GCRY01000567.1.p1  ORF type:complete len:440 (+),score=72.84 GCRY01000567.1:144-1322(+)
MNKGNKRRRNSKEAKAEQLESEQQRRSASNPNKKRRYDFDRQSCDDEEGHIMMKPGDTLKGGKYSVVRLVGQGTFGKVFVVVDEANKAYAIKIIRSVPKYRESAKQEMKILMALNFYDPKRHWHCVQLHEAFDHRRHICMVFDFHGPSLYEFMRMNDFFPFRLLDVKEIAWQLVRGTRFIHKLQLVHTDLKPENILLTHHGFAYESIIDKRTNQARNVKVPLSSMIQIIDFGSATFEYWRHSSVVSTRHYRAPEVILGHGWSFPCDMWSVGCILVELCLGQALFITHENYEQLAMMERVLGPMPSDFLKRSDPYYRKYFTRDYRLNFPELCTSTESENRVKKLKPLQTLLKGAPEKLVDFIQRCLEYKPEARMTAREGIRHPYFAEYTEGLM